MRKMCRIAASRLVNLNQKISIVFFMQESPKMCNSLSKSVKTLGKGKYFYQALMNRLLSAFHWIFKTLCNWWLIVKILHFCSQTRSLAKNAGVSIFLTTCLV